MRCLASVKSSEATKAFSLLAVCPAIALSASPRKRSTVCGCSQLLEVLPLLGSLREEELEQRAHSNADERQGGNEQWRHNITLL